MSAVQAHPDAIAVDRAVDVAEAAEILGVSVITVKRGLEAWLAGNESELPSFKMGEGEGRRRKIWLSDLRKWTVRRMLSERARRAEGGGQ